MANKMGGSVKWTGLRLLRTKLTAIRFLQGGLKRLIKRSKKKKKKNNHTDCNLSLQCVESE